MTLGIQDLGRTLKQDKSSSVSSSAEAWLFMAYAKVTFCQCNYCISQFQIKYSVKIKIEICSCMCWPSFHASTYSNKGQHIQLKMLKSYPLKVRILLKSGDFFFIIIFTKINFFKYLTTFLNNKNEQSWFMESFLRHVKMHKFVFGRGGGGRSPPGPPTRSLPWTHRKPPA